ncbi:hypothetical protein [Lysinibacillus sp. NPDC093688]|uniref:hypothetical protein n=1 Tax=Lysinibacillus sp. NPDC093688 TaxID=3390577 RepID=UPI003CFF5DD9
MKKICLALLCTILVLPLFLFNQTVALGAQGDIETLNSTPPFDTNVVLETKEVDGKVVTIYEDLPDTFSVNANQETGEQSISPLCATCNQKVYTKVNTWTESSDYNFGWHPGFSGYNRASGYWFSTSSVSFSVSVSYGPLSVSIADAGGNGYYISADYSQWSRPAVFGKYIVTKYKVDEYNPAGIFLKTYYENYPSAQSTYVKILYK